MNVAYGDINPFVDVYNGHNDLLDTALSDAAFAIGNYELTGDPLSYAAANDYLEDADSEMTTLEGVDVPDSYVLGTTQWQALWDVGNWMNYYYP